MATRGTDQWAPALIFAWGETREDNRTIPIAYAFDDLPKLSASEREGPVSMPLTLPATVDPSIASLELLVVIETADSKNADTKSPALLHIEREGGLSVVQLPETAQRDLRRGVTNLYLVDLAEPPGIRPSTIRSVTLLTSGDDAWLPRNVWIWGVRRLYQQVVLIAELRDNNVWLSRNLTEGSHTEKLEIPLVT